MTGSSQSAAATIATLAQRALEEDRATVDWSSLAVVPEGARARGRVLARESGVLAGRAYAEACFARCEPEARQDWRVADGDRIEAGQLLLEVVGSARGLLAAERSALNFLQQLSGVASLTARLVQLAAPLRVLDTRKTVPGLRDAQKEAVRAGGGQMQRRDLEEEMLLKENHFAVSGLDYASTVRRARREVPDLVLGVEARTGEQAAQAIEAGADYVLLDNFEPTALAATVRSLRARWPGAVLEASGGYGAHNLAEIADSDVDRVSIGGITHSAPALDLSFYLEAER